MAKAKRKLSEALKGKYKLAPSHGVGEYHYAGYKVNLADISLERADYLVSKGFPYLLPIKPPKPATFS